MSVVIGAEESGRILYSRRALEHEVAGPPHQEGPDPGEEVVIDPIRAQGGTKDVGINLIEATLNIKK